MLASAAYAEEDTVLYPCTTRKAHSTVHTDHPKQVFFVHSLNLYKVSHTRVSISLLNEPFYGLLNTFSIKY